MMMSAPMVFCSSIDFSGVSMSSLPSWGDWNLTPSCSFAPDGVAGDTWSHLCLGGVSFPTLTPSPQDRSWT